MNSLAAGPDREALAHELALRALAEDGPSDITSEIVGAAGRVARGRLEFRSGGVLAGRRYATAVAGLCELATEWGASDGDAVAPRTIVCTVRGDLAAILRAERPMLNLLQRACGIATATRAVVDALAGTGCQVLHTRKTAPGLRWLDVDAVLAGGGRQHRLSLADAVLVKDNHWHVLAERSGDLKRALEQARSRGVTDLYVEVESVDQVKTACSAGATRLLVDNQPPEIVKQWCSIARSSRREIEIEASGGLTLDNVRLYAESGVDFVSLGALTHSVQAADLALEITDL
ncbi:MAG: carboxylating nicotinate-nucleotide diphosphorylase [Gemmatimonadota bacterium]|nr:MAG: carboxylating nicotinate-nucleotide diphosphorylase [Gemmatimonadota bacterium]